MAFAGARAKTPDKLASFERGMEDRFTRTLPRGSRWDQEGAEFVSSDSEWCDRFSARLIALLVHVDYGLASGTALDLVSNHALRALSPEWVAEDLARARVSLD